MTNEFISAKTLLESKGISLLYAARLICNALDYMPRNSTLTPIQFCSKIIEAGQRHVEMSLAEGFALYLKSKQHLRKDSFNDIRYLGNRLSRAKPELGKRNFSELSASECEEWLNAGQTKSGGIFSRVCNVFAGTLQSLCVNGKPAYKAALFNGRCFYAERGENGFEDRRIVEAAEFTRIDLEFEKSAILETLPTTFQMVGKFTKATYNWAKSGFKLADEAELARRTQICNKCKFWYPAARMGLGKCLKCGCSLAKLKLASEECPIGKW